nr:hypothetical protein [Rhizoctonia sp.]
MFYADHNQPIGLDLGGNNLTLEVGLLLSSLLPVKLKRLTKAEQEQFVLTEELKAILVGLLLGDLYAEKLAINARFKFKQSTIHEGYLIHLYELFKTFCPQGPKMDYTTLSGKVYSSLYFKTYSLPCFGELYNSFYPFGRKIVPLNIGELLTPSSLAYWVADDGSFNQTYRIVILNTQCFSWEEVNLLAEIINNKFKLNCTINKSRNGFVIRISRNSLKDLQTLLEPLMPPMMLYKIGL